MEVINKHLRPAPTETETHDSVLDISRAVTKEDKILTAHLARYLWAYTVARAAAARNVLDLGCGCGYGCRILAERDPQTGYKATAVVGVDNDVRAMQWAMGCYDGFGIEYHNINLENHWTSGVLQQRYDVVTCFELLEQLFHREFFLHQLGKVVSPSTTVLFSVPFAGRTDCHSDPKSSINDLPAHADRFHYNLTVLKDTLWRYFDQVAVIDDPAMTASRGGFWGWYQSLASDVPSTGAILCSGYRQVLPSQTP